MRLFCDVTCVKVCVVCDFCCFFPRRFRSAPTPTADDERESKANDQANKDDDTPQTDQAENVRASCNCGLTLRILSSTSHRRRQFYALCVAFLSLATCVPRASPLSPKRAATRNVPPKPPFLSPTLFLCLSPALTLSISVHLPSLSLFLSTHSHSLSHPLTLSPIKSLLPIRNF